MIKVNGIEVTKGCTVKFRCGGSAEVFECHECLRGEDGKRPVNLLFSEKARSGMTFLHNGEHRMGQSVFDIIEVIPPEFNWKDAKWGMAFKNIEGDVFHYIGKSLQKDYVVIQYQGTNTVAWCTTGWQPIRAPEHDMEASHE